MQAYSGKHPALLYFTSLACICGIFVLLGLAWVLPFFFVLAYLALFFAFLSSARSSNDWLNPLTLFLIMGFIRFSIPGFMILLGVEHRIPLFYVMKIERQDWILGHVLGLMGILGVVAGWSLNLGLPPPVLRRVESLTMPRIRALPLAAVLCMFLGFAALAVFVGSHADIEEAVYSGEIRRTAVESGTGKFFRVALMLVSSSVVLSTYLAGKGCAWWVAMLPNGFAMISLSILGGRSLAALPLVAAWIILWYRGDFLKTSMKIVFVLGIALLPVYSYLGQVYRGGQGLEGVLAQGFSIATLVDHMKYSLWVDWGSLHSMAAATMIGPGVLGGYTFTVLLWPLSKILQLPGRSAGVYMAEELVGFDESAPADVRSRWGFHATLIGDAYLNFGLLGVLAATIIFGIVLRILYLQIRLKISNIAVYALGLACALRLFFVSIENFPNVLVIMVFTVFVIQIGRLLTLRSAGEARTQPRNIITQAEWTARTRS
jgi:hypothetical protein